MKLANGPWKLSDLKSVSENGMKVFSCFHCGGGSTMGYKLSGFEVLGGVEIDPKMMDVYRSNHNPKFSYLMGVQEFKEKAWASLPKELFNLDILDGSPPCSSFSMAGSREKAWGTEKKFREGQAEQKLDELFFDFIDIAQMLKPRVVVAENVKGLIQGNAKGYVREIALRFERAGYDLQLFLLNAAFMGVPQRRERTVFIAKRKDLNLPKIKMHFNEPVISIEEAFKGLPLDSSEMKDGSVKHKWKMCPVGSFAKAPSGNTFGFIYRADPKKPCTTVTGQPRVYHWKYPRRFNVAEVIRAQTFPDDFNFISDSVSVAHYLCGMSVPPFMMQRISAEIYKQWLCKLKIVKKAAKQVEKQVYG